MPVRTPDAALRPHGAGHAVEQIERKRRLPDLAGTTIGTWRVLYETVVDRRRHCMCQCVECGVRKIIMAFKLRQRYALRCRACKVSQELVAV